MIGKNAKETCKNLASLSLEGRVKFVCANKSELLDQKKLELKEADALSCFFSKEIDDEIDKSTENKKENTNYIERSIVGSSAMVFDSHYDVHGDGCWEKTIKESQSKFYHTKNHSRYVDDKVGVFSKVYTKRIKTKSLGVSSSVKDVECLLGDTKIYKALDEKMYTQYHLGMVNQHSVGMYYVKISLAINNPSEAKEFELYNKYIDKIVNREDVESIGFFWYVSEAKLAEISAVTKGSNQLTPTTELKNVEPLKNTQKTIENEAADSTSKSKSFFKQLM